MEVVVKDGRAHMFDETGAPVSVDEGELQSALASGFRPQTREEYEQRVMERERSTLGQQALTAGEGAVRGATFGLGTAALAELGGDEYRKAASERAAVNPKLAVGGEVVGTVLPTLLSGGAGAAGAAARATPAALAARLGTVAEHGAGALTRAVGLGGAGFASKVAAEAIKLGVAGAVEGAAYGLGSSLADSALEGTEWTAERALAGLEHGALYGATGGALVGAGGVVVGKAGRAVLDRMVGEGKTFRQAVQEFADRRAVKAVVGNDIATFRKLTNNGEDMGRLERVAEKLRARNVIGATDEDMLNAINREADSATERLANVATDLDNAGIRPSAKRIFEQVDDQVKRLREVGTADHARVANRIEQQVAQLRKSSTVRVARPDGSVARVQRDPTFTELRRFKTGLGEATHWHKASQSMAADEMQKLYGSVAKTLDEAADAAGGNAAKMWREANEDASDFLTLKKGLETEIQRKAKNRFVSPSDYGTGLSTAIATMVTGAGAPAAVLTGIGMSLAHKFVRERGSAAIGKLADWAAGIEVRMGRSAKRLAGTHTTGEAAAAGAVARRTGLERLKAVGERGASLSVNERDVADRADARRTLVRGWLPIAVEGDRQERFDAAVHAIRAVQQNPAELLGRIERTIAPFAHEQPEVAAAVSRRIVADYQWLEAQLPAESTGFGRTIGPKKPPVVSRSEQKKLVSYAEALVDPVGVFEDASQGVIDFDALDAVKARRPDLYASQAAMVAMEVASAEKAPPHGQRVFLSIAFGLPLDASLEPGAFEPEEGGGAPQLDAPSELNPEAAAEGMSTPAQQAEAAHAA